MSKKIMQACLVVLVAVIATLVMRKSRSDPGASDGAAVLAVGAPAPVTAPVLVSEIPVELTPAQAVPMACDPSACFVSCRGRGYCEGECTASGTCRCFLRPDASGNCP